MNHLIKYHRNRVKLEFWGLGAERGFWDVLTLKVCPSSLLIMQCSLPTVVFQGCEVIAVLLVLSQVGHPIHLLLMSCKLSTADNGAFVWTTRLHSK